MKHYRDPIANEIYAYAADGSQDAYIKAGLVPISDAELAALRAPTAEQMKEAAISAIKGRIASLEQSQSRAVREALLGGPTDRLAALEAQIVVERAALVKAPA